MTPEEFERERKKSAEMLARVVDEARGLDLERQSESVLGPVPPARVTSAVSSPETSELPPWNPPAPPDLRPVNTSWQTGAPQAAGALSSLLGGSRERARETQLKFNSDQVQLDNGLIQWTAEHFAATHQHFDAVIGLMQRRMDDIDTRHRELERELVRHVHEMARRIDVVLGEGEKGRVSHEAALRSVRERLSSLEEKLR